MNVLRSPRSGIDRLYPLALLAVLCMTNGGTVALTQTDVAKASPAVAQTLEKVSGVRDAFLERARAAGFKCAISQPRIIIDDVPSFGNYNENANTLRTSEWSLLKPEERSLFFRLAGPGATEAAAAAFFDESVHRWIFVHELGHWVQACRGVTAGPHPYRLEYGADRLDLAYWREADPAFAGKMLAVFQGMMAHMPTPVPAGQPVEGYFDANYQTLGPSPAYPWFQARMIVTGSEEKPTPSFAEALGSIKP